MRVNFMYFKQKISLHVPVWLYEIVGVFFRSDFLFLMDGTGNIILATPEGNKNLHDINILNQFLIKENGSLWFENIF